MAFRISFPANCRMKDHDLLSAASGASKCGMHSVRQLYCADPQQRISDRCFIKHQYDSERIALLWKTIHYAIGSFAPVIVSAFIVSFLIRQTAGQRFRKRTPECPVRIISMIQYFRRNSEREPFSVFCRKCFYRRQRSWSFMRQFVSFYYSEILFLWTSGGNL